MKLNQILYPHTICEQSQQENIKIQNQGKKNFMDVFFSSDTLVGFFSNVMFQYAKINVILQIFLRYFTVFKQDFFMTML